MEFKDPWVLVLLPVIVGMVWFLYRRQQRGAFGFSSLEAMEKLPGTWKMKFSLVPFVLRLIAIVLLCVALAGPRKVLEETKIATDGIDIVLALDCSGSMAGEDFKIDGKRMSRFEIIKKVVAEFINGRPYDQLSLIAFAGRAYTVCPLTTDRNWLLANLDRLKLGLIEDGTAIGSGIASALTRFKNSNAKSKIIILLTDGMNNAGSIDPLTAAKTAAAMGIKVYTIGAGSKGLIPFPVNFFGRIVYQQVQSDLDEETLTKIAQMTKGAYFRATDTETLRGIYQQIDRLEKTKIEQVGYKQYKEFFYVFVMAALIVCGLEQLLVNTVFFKIP